MTKRTLTLITLAATLAACSSMPERNSDLDRARGRFNAAQRDTQVVTYAPEELKQAGATLDQAQNAWTNQVPKSTVDHLSYMAAQRVLLAQETASARASQAVTAAAASERNAMRLDQRTAEANQARRALVVSEQNNAIKSGQLMEADANVQRAQDSADSSNARANSSEARANSSEARANALEMELQALNAKKTDRGMVITLGDVLFESGQDRLLAAGAGAMARVAQAFTRNPALKATIEGYTDSVGKPDLNLDLSARRARTVQTALVAQGVRAEQLTTRGFGEANPVGDNATPTGRQLNRRVEIVFGQQGPVILAK